MIESICCGVRDSIYISCSCIIQTAPRVISLLLRLQKHQSHKHHHPLDFGGGARDLLCCCCWCTLECCALNLLPAQRCVFSSSSASLYVFLCGCCWGASSCLSLHTPVERTDEEPTLSPPRPSRRADDGCCRKRGSINTRLRATLRVDCDYTFGYFLDSSRTMTVTQPMDKQISQTDGK